MIPKRPELLPEQKVPDSDTKPSKPKHRTRTALWILVLLLLFSFGILIVIIVDQPEIVGLERSVDVHLTEEAIQSTVISLDATATNLTSGAVNQQSQSANLQNTQAALNYRESVISGQETEQFVNRISTQTAVAVQNSQQATQSALNFQATQQALQIISTQVQMEFQATQTAIAGGIWTPEPTAAPNVLIVDEGIINRLETGVWDNIPTSSAWAVNSSGQLVAQTANATLITRYPIPLSTYTSVVSLSPVSVNTHYDTIIGVKDSGQALGLRVFHDGNAITTVGFFTFESTALANGVLVTGAETIESLGGLNIQTQQVNIAIAVDGRNITAIINDRPLLNSEVDPALTVGRSALQVPNGTQVSRFVQVSQ